MMGSTISRPFSASVAPKKPDRQSGLKAQQRRQLNTSRKRNDLDRNSSVREVFGRILGILRGNANGREFFVVLSCRCFRRCHNHFAVPNVQVEGLMDVGTRFRQDIPARNADVATPYST
jgi:hypothetical protein